MNRRNVTTLFVIAAAGLGVLSGPMLAQQKSLKDQLVGSWTFISALETYPDGRKTDRWGPNPKGTLMFDANGRYVQIISRSDIPKFAANKPDMGTADENKAVVANMVVGFGTYTVNETDKTLITRVEGGLFPNAIGSEQKRIISSLTADELKYTNPTTTMGSVAEATWKRVK
jgi:hypothetical protein